ncbi:MAG: hypothetical protein AAFW69_00640 [Pseudomonadota bacterium]
MRRVMLLLALTALAGCSAGAGAAIGLAAGAVKGVVGGIADAVAGDDGDAAEAPAALAASPPTVAETALSLEVYATRRRIAAAEGAVGRARALLPPGDPRVPDLVRTAEALATLRGGVAEAERRGDGAALATLRTRLAQIELTLAG